MEEKALSLEQVEGANWGEPPADSTRLVASVHALRRRPIAELGAEGLRLLISQRVGLAEIDDEVQTEIAKLGSGASGW
ncbi:hypothetical protein FB565_005535 [Actinoplanes lutulentus]|uniref:Uncharacterized protein n=1 Tax=Actinoplanes lutulentus TaxID=1287878 RepID=A0A327ZBM4_9ACTN|nr:contact-dependent growth inhibition system immunity protein [Actinoplanes lutulentus]MBB2945777.1 hypothetical protein [Actinoplanes lutulentus]RAK37826.1 hypothetical protein B0I29_10694 [Actinoplanes lutulentus]